MRHWLPRLRLPPGSPCLDLACGAGRNALFLAESGHQVVAIDGSRVAIEQLDAAASRRAVTVRSGVVDLEPGQVPPEWVAEGGFGLILLVRYVNESLLKTLPSLLRPGGWLLAEEHLQTDSESVGGPRRAAFRVPRDALARAVAGLNVVSLEQGRVRDPDGLPMAVARLVSKRPRER